MTLQDVVEATALLRQQVANRPLLLFAVLFVLLAALPPWRREPGRASTNIPALLATLAIGFYAALVMWYVAKDGYADAAEPTMAAVATLFDAGRPVYHALDAAERYSHIYGPLAFIVPSWCLALFGSSLTAAKIPGAAAGLLSVAAVFALTWRRRQTRTALLLTGLFCGLCLTFQHTSFWIRPDSFELLLAAIALLAVRLPHAAAAALALGIVTGVLAGLKMTGPLYALPAFGVLVSQRRLASIPFAAVVAAVVAVLPFLAFGNVSFDNYLLWVGVSANNGLVFWTLKQNLEWSLFLLLPVLPLMLRRPEQRIDPWLLATTGAGMVLVALAASKPGAGRYHLMPFIPAILHAAANGSGAASTPENARYFRAGVRSFALSCAIVVALQVAYFLWAANRTDGLALAADVTRFLDAHPSDRIEMGYSAQDEAFSYVRPLVVFRQRAYLLDAPAVQEYQLSGLALPDATLRAIEQCDVDAWLIARGAEPFSLRNRYPSTGHAPLFTDAMRQTFLAAYARTSSTEYFDVWTCRQPRR